jgi:hypothetical protein
MRDFSFLRVWLWQSWQNEVQGTLIWNTNYWHSSKVYPQGLQNPCLDTMSWNDGYGTQVGEKRPWAAGDGRLVYPPEVCYAKLLEVPAAISGGLTTYTNDPAPITARRQELAKAIEKLTNTERR